MNFFHSFFKRLSKTYTMFPSNRWPKFNHTLTRNSYKAPFLFFFKACFKKKTLKKLNSYNVERVAFPTGSSICTTIFGKHLKTSTSRLPSQVSPPIGDYALHVKAIFIQTHEVHTLFLALLKVQIDFPLIKTKA